MRKNQTDEVIRSTAKRLFAKHGYDGVSMRILAKESGVGLSSIYHFHKDKDVLLKAIYDDTNRSLGVARKALPPMITASEKLRQLIHFQFDHIENVVYVLKYYLSFRHEFAALPTKTLPAKALVHVEEVLHKGNDTGEYSIVAEQIPAKARVITHTINGYLLEYYPDVPRGKERHQIIDDIVSFTMTGVGSRSTAQ